VFSFSLLIIYSSLIIIRIYIYGIGDNTGLPRPPAFLSPSLTENLILENGVNYASGGGGILNETGGYFVS
jgi:hypothetical protein